MTSNDPSLQLAASLQENNLDIFEYSLTVANVTDPEQDVNHYAEQMDKWAEELSVRVAEIQDIRMRLEHLNKFFFSDLGFRGNQEDFHNPENSLITEVMESRLGIPITLSILYLTLGKKLGLPLEGISFPGHFLVKLTLAEGIVILDPYNGGLCLDEKELADLMLKNQKDSTAELLLKSLENASSKETLMRMLRNLKLGYQDEDDHERLLNILNMMLAIDPELREERLERGKLLHEMECGHVGLPDLLQYLTQTAFDKNDDVLRLVNQLNAGSPAIH